MRPATALPWVLRSREDGLGAIDATDTTPVAQAFQVLPRDEDLKQVTRQQNAAYIVEACNNYPRLVAALRESEKEMTISVDRLNMMANYGKLAPLVKKEAQAIADKLAHELLSARALLAELGEAE